MILAQLTVQLVQLYCDLSVLSGAAAVSDNVDSSRPDDGRT